MKTPAITLLLRYVPGIVFLFALLALLEALSATGMTNPAVLPPPTRVATRLGDILSSGAFLEPTLQTLAILLSGWFIASLMAIVFGILMGYFQPAYRLFEPLVELIRPVPKPALIPPLFLLLGLGTAMQLAIVVLGAFFAVLIPTIQGVRGVDPIQLNVARTFRAGTWRTIAYVVLPSALPMILSGMKVALSLSLILAVLAEMLTGSGGLGAVIVNLQTLFRSADMYAWIVILATVGFILVVGFETLERKAVFWLGR
ncbi:MAG: ABC transporter permease [Aquisalimonadaceae bacterium]